MDHYTADKGVDKALFIILSLLTDKQAYFSETVKPNPQDLQRWTKHFCSDNKETEAATDFLSCQCF